MRKTHSVPSQLDRSFLLKTPNPVSSIDSIFLHHYRKPGRIETPRVNWNMKSLRSRENQNLCADSSRVPDSPSLPVPDIIVPPEPVTATHSASNQARYILVRKTVKVGTM